MEGIYIKWEEEGCVRGRYKYVRASFTQAVEQEGVHWLDRPLEPNLLRDGIDILRINPGDPYEDADGALPDSSRLARRLGRNRPIIRMDSTAPRMPAGRIEWHTATLV